MGMGTAAARPKPWALTCLITPASNTTTSLANEAAIALLLCRHYLALLPDTRTTFLDMPHWAVVRVSHQRAIARASWIVLDLT